MGKLPPFQKFALTRILMNIQDDGIIPPQHTRRYLGLGLNASMGGKNEVKAGDTKFGVFRM